MKTSTSPKPSKFEEDLKTYFPDMYNFWSLSKFDSHYPKLITTVLDMVNANKYGVIEIHYQKGKVNYIIKKENVTANS